MRIFMLSLMQLLLVTSAFANYRSYEGEKEEYRQVDEGGGAAVYGGYGGFVVPEEDNPDPAYDSTIDEDMLFDSYHNKN